MSDKKQQILDLVTKFIQEEKSNKTWTPGVDWIQYSGPFFDENEYSAAVESLLNGWFILGENGRKFERLFSPKLGKSDGILVNSGSSANLLMVSLLRTKRGGIYPKEVNSLPQ